MSFIYLYRTKVAIVLLAFIFTFKIVNVGEYLHIEQHKTEAQNSAHCQVCHLLLKIDKQLILPNTICGFSFLLKKVEDIEHNIFSVFIFYNKLLSLTFFNRPPPVFIF